MPLTLRELVWATQGKEYSEWERTAEIWAVIAESNRDPKRKATPFRATDLFRRPSTRQAPRGVPLDSQSFQALKSVFVKPRQ